MTAAGHEGAADTRDPSVRPPGTTLSAALPVITQECAGKKFLAKKVEDAKKGRAAKPSSLLHFVRLHKGSESDAAVVEGGIL